MAETEVEISSTIPITTPFVVSSVNDETARGIRRAATFLLVLSIISLPHSVAIIVSGFASIPSDGETATGFRPFGEMVAELMLMTTIFHHGIAIVGGLTSSIIVLLSSSHLLVQKGHTVRSFAAIAAIMSLCGAVSMSGLAAVGLPPFYAEALKAQCIIFDEKVKVDPNFGANASVEESCHVFVSRVVTRLLLLGAFLDTLLAASALAVFTGVGLLSLPPRPPQD